MKKDIGARWEITVDGVPRSYRDRKEMAIQGAEYLKARNPGAEVMGRDLERIDPIALMQWLRESRSYGRQIANADYGRTRGSLPNENAPKPRNSTRSPRDIPQPIPHRQAPMNEKPPIPCEPVAERG